MKTETICGLIGNTPVVRVGTDSDVPLKLYAKLDCMNPSGSSSDRSAYWIIKGLMSTDGLKAGDLLISPVAGDMAISLAMICSSSGIGFMPVMPEEKSAYIKDVLDMFGAERVCTPDEKGMNGAREKAWELCEAFRGSFYIEPERSPDAARAHYESTAPEIMRDLPETDIFVASAEDIDAIIGISRYFRAIRPEIRIVGARAVPDGGKRGSHSMVEEDVPPMLLRYLDEVVDVPESETVRMLSDAARYSGIMTGRRGAAALAVGRRTAEEDPGRTVCVLCPDGPEHRIIS